MSEEVKKSLIGDLAGLSEPLKKLFEVVSSGVGRLTGTIWLDKRDADNEAYKILKVGGAQTQVVVDRMKAIGAISSGSTPQVQKLTLLGNEVNAELSDGQQAVLALKERSDNRTEYQNLLHQLNIEQTVSFAAEELSQEGAKVSKESVDDNWKARYFNIVQDISNEEMQAMWGKILAGEIKKPNTFSLRTLEVLRNLTQREASIFTDACKYLLVSRAGDSKRNYDFYRNPIGSGIYGDIGYRDVLDLMDCGLLQSSFTNMLSVSKMGEVNIGWQVADKYLSIRIENSDGREIILQTYSLSRAGIELSSLINAESPIDYLQSVANQFRKLDAVVSYSEFENWSEQNTAICSDVEIELPSAQSL